MTEVLSESREALAESKADKEHHETLSSPSPRLSSWRFGGPGVRTVALPSRWRTWRRTKRRGVRASGNRRRSTPMATCGPMFRRACRLPPTVARAPPISPANASPTNISPGMAVPPAPTGAGEGPGLLVRPDEGGARHARSPADFCGLAAKPHQRVDDRLRQSRRSGAAGEDRDRSTDRARRARARQEGTGRADARRSPRSKTRRAAPACRPAGCVRGA